MDFAIDKFNPDRLGTITGSSCYILHPDKGDGKAGMTTYAKRLAKERYFQFYDEVSTWEMRHGEMGESWGLAHLQKYYSKDFIQGDFIRDGEFSGTCDAIAPTCGADIKCPTTMDKWLDYLYDGISKQQYHQCQMYMWLFNRPRWIVAAYLIETGFMSDNGLTYPVDESDRMIIFEVERDENWAEKLKINAKFVIETRDGYIDILKNKIKKC